MLAFSVAIAAALGSAHALSTPSHFSSSMVLQRGVSLNLWGMDVAGAVINVNYRGLKLPPVTADGTGRFSVPLPAMLKNSTPAAIVITSPTGQLTLDDTVVGDVYFCSGQSNMAISVSWQAEYAGILAAAGALGPWLRIIQVAQENSYTNATTPASNFTASIPWSRASATSAPLMSGLCYLFGAEIVNKQPDLPVGMISTAWGGVAIQVYMSPAALAQCAAAPSPASTSGAMARAAEIVALADRALASTLQGEGRLSAGPVAPSCLYNSMVAPFLGFPVNGILWYQGEANSMDPLGYECLQRAMVEDWRASWAAAGSAPVLPFVFVQLACWPTGATNNYLSIFRYAQQQMVAQLPRAGMVVSADMCDPAGAFHPIHPPFKAELARRAYLWADAEIYGNASSPRAAPFVVSAVWDAWKASWGDYHYGTGSGTSVCSYVNMFSCGGLRISFDRPVALRSFYVPPPAMQTEGMYGFTTGAASGFVLSQNVSATLFSQPVTLTSLSPDGLTAQLNVTWINPADYLPIGGTLCYGWGDYPIAMPLVDAATGAPIAPFNISFPDPPRATNGTCRYVANTDGASSGMVLPGTSTAECCALCWADASCAAVAFDASAPTACYLKHSTASVPKAGVTLCVLDV